MSHNPYAPPPMLPRQWLPLPPGTLVGTPPHATAPNPLSINWPASQFARPRYVAGSVRFVPPKPVPAAERQSTAPEHWPRGQFAGYGALENPALPSGTALALGVAALALFVVLADRHLAPVR